MLLFWKGTTKQGLAAAILVLVPFSQPGIVTIPLGFAMLVVVSLFTRGRDQSRSRAV